jgi:hypothetical protein
MTWDVGCSSSIPIRKRGDALDRRLGFHAARPAPNQSQCSCKQRSCHWLIQDHVSSSLPTTALMTNPYLFTPPEGSWKKDAFAGMSGRMVDGSTKSSWGSLQMNGYQADHVTPCFNAILPDNLGIGTGNCVAWIINVLPLIRSMTREDYINDVTGPI